MSRRKVQFLRSLAQAGGRIEPLIPRHARSQFRIVHDEKGEPVRIRDRGKTCCLAPEDGTLTRWLRWQSDALRARKGKL